MGIAGSQASRIMFAEAAGFEAWDRLTNEQTQDFKSAASIMMGQMGGMTTGVGDIGDSLLRH
jgi:hypothetical protein